MEDSLEDIAEREEGGICILKGRAVNLYKSLEEAQQSPFYACHICNGHNYSCVDYVCKSKEEK